MRENINLDYYAGTFKIMGEEIIGNLVLDKEYGIIKLSLEKKTTSEYPFGKQYGNGKISQIKGKLNSGAFVTLFNNSCIDNNTKFYQSQKLTFKAEYMIWSNKERSDFEFKKMTCTFKNAYAWSELSPFEVPESRFVLKLKEEFEKKECSWFGAEITFATSLKNFPLTPHLEEETQIIKRLMVSIEMDSKKEVEELIY